MMTFQKKKYELLFSNGLPPLTALNYADVDFFREFQRLCGARYRILSIIKNNSQNKYGLKDDLILLEAAFERKLKDKDWPGHLLKEYIIKSKKLNVILSKLKKDNPKNNPSRQLIATLKNIKKISTTLDAMSNMLYLFSVLVGPKLNLSRYSSNNGVVNKNLIYYTQPIKESRFAKIKIKRFDKKFKLNDYDSLLSTLLRLGSYVKDDVSLLLDRRLELAKPILDEVASRINVTTEDLYFLQLKEIEIFLLKDYSPKGLIKERKKLTLIFYNKGPLTIIEGKVAMAFLKSGNLKEEKVQKTSILLGQCASSGSAKGIAVVATNSIDALRRMKKGNILVAPYTSVEYLPSMKLAAAIVTETGGITSHAAIISREFNIPCVIGVKDATKLIKNGKIITLDADSGTVNIQSKV